jgi:nucleoside 2-deoxyribosyltransferase
MLDKSKLINTINELERKISLQAPVFNERDINHLNNLKKLLKEMR